MTSMHRVVWILVVILVVVGGAVGAVETLGRSWLADQIATGLQTQQFLPSKPAVQVTGGPLTLSLPQGRVDAVEIDAPVWPLKVNDKEVAVQGVSFDALSIRIEGDKAIVGDLTGTGRLDWAGVSTLLGMRVSDRGGGRLRVEYVLGNVMVDSLELSAELRLDPEAQELTLAAPQLLVDGREIPPAIVEAVLAAVVKPIPLTLDGGLRLTQLAPSESGLQLSLAGRDFPLTWRS